MSKIIALFMPSNLKKGIVASQKFMEGKKSYLAGSILILQGLAILVNDFIACGEDMSCIVNIFTKLSTNEGVVIIANGLAIFGIRSALGK